MNRWVWTGVLAGLVLSVASVQSPAAKEAPAGGHAVTKNVYSFRVKTIDGKNASLADFKGKTLLIVNTASKCGHTPQYAGLETLYEKYKDQGFEVLAFPANNFGQQEPGTNAEIKTFCATNYKTTFPLFSKVSVKGKDMTPLYHYLTTETAFPGDITWNFTKFLVAPDGKVVARFTPKQEPLDPDITAKIETTLAAKAGQAGGQ